MALRPSYCLPLGLSDGPAHPHSHPPPHGGCRMQAVGRLGELLGLGLLSLILSLKRLPYPKVTS
jgi:hypothetical protein